MKPKPSFPFTILIVFFSLHLCHAQNLTVKPYLVIEDTTNHKEYRLRSQKVYLKTISDDEAKPDKLSGYLSDSVVRTRKHGNVSVSEIAQISFRPTKTRRTFEQVSYATFFATEIVLCTMLLRSGPTEGGGFMILPATIAPFMIAFAELGGTIVQAYTPWVILDKNEMRMYVVQSSSGTRF